MNLTTTLLLAAFICVTLIESRHTNDHRHIKHPENGEDHHKKTEGPKVRLDFDPDKIHRKEKDFQKEVDDLKEGGVGIRYPQKKINNPELSKFEREKLERELKDLDDVIYDTRPVGEEYEWVRWRIQKELLRKEKENKKKQQRHKRSIHDNEIHNEAFDQEFVPLPNEKDSIRANDYFNYWNTPNIDPNNHHDSVPLVAPEEPQLPNDDALLADFDLYDSLDLDYKPEKSPQFLRFAHLRFVLEEALELLDILETVDDIAEHSDDLYLRCFMKNNIGNLWQQAVKNINADAFASDKCLVDEEQSLEDLLL